MHTWGTLHISIYVYNVPGQDPIHFSHQINREQHPANQKQARGTLAASASALEQRQPVVETWSERSITVV